MKKILKVMFIFILIISLCACKNKSSDKNNDDGKNSANTNIDNSYEYQTYLTQGHSMEIPAVFFESYVGAGGYLLGEGDREYISGHKVYMFFDRVYVDKNYDKGKTDEELFQDVIYEYVNSRYPVFSSTVNNTTESTKTVTILDRNFERRTGIIEGEYSRHGEHIYRNIYYIMYIGKVDYPSYISDSEYRKPGAILMGFTDALDDDSKLILNGIVDHAAETLQLYENY